MEESKSSKGILKADQYSRLMEERIAYASQFIVEVQVALKSGLIYPQCVVASKFDPNSSTWFDIVIGNANGISKRIHVSDIKSFVIL